MKRTHKKWGFWQLGKGHVFEQRIIYLLLVVDGNFENSIARANKRIKKNRQRTIFEYL